MFNLELYQKLIEMIKRSRFFDKVEINVIYSMLELEKKGKIKSTASEIAKNAGITVTNAYKYLYNLSNLGIVEYEENKQKLFWLSRINPFDRIIAIITKDFLEKKASLVTAGEIYKKIVSNKKIQEKARVKKFESNFEILCAFIADHANKELCVISNWIPEDFIILDSWKRCEKRNVEMKWLASELEEEKVNFLKSLGFEVRFTEEVIYPFIMVSDERNGIVIERLSEKNIKGFYFLNCINDFKEHFTKWWENAGEIK